MAELILLILKLSLEFFRSSDRKRTLEHLNNALEKIRDARDSVLHDANSVQNDKNNRDGR